MDDFVKYKPIVYDIIGASMEVYNELNFGLVESIYQEALEKELKTQGINPEVEVDLPVFYKGQPLEKTFRADLIVNDIIIELKAVTEIAPEHRAQLCNYLRLAKKPIGLLINFGGHSLYGERWGYDKNNNECYKLNKEMLPLD